MIYIRCAIYEVDYLRNDQRFYVVQLSDYVPDYASCFLCDDLGWTLNVNNAQKFDVCPDVIGKTIFYQGKEIFSGDEVPYVAKGKELAHNCLMRGTRNKI